MPGQLTDIPCKIIRQLIIDLGEGTDPDDSDTWPAFASKMPDNPHNAILVRDTEPIPQGRVAYGQDQMHRAMQVTVRGTTEVTAYEKCESIRSQLESVNRSNVTVGANTYFIDAIFRRSGPLPIGPEPPEGRRELVTLNISCPITETV